MCDHHRLDNPDGLQCDRPDCDGRGHTYTATVGPDLDQPRHHATGDEQ